MRPLASYIMRGQLQAITTVAASAVLALVAMPLSWPISYFSAGGVGLVTLVHGPKEGGKTLLGATLILALLGMITLGNAGLALGFALSLWLPAWLLSSVLRLSRSLVLPVQALLILGLLAVAGLYGVMGDPAQWWYLHIVNDVIPALEKANVVFQRGAEFDTQLHNATRLMTGALVMVTAWGMLAGLMIARWWQAALHRPGAFGEEFRDLRLGRVVTVVAVLLIALATLLKGPLAEMAGNMLLVMIGLVILQGLALAHALAARFKAHPLWLGLLYMLLVFFMSMLVMLAVAGLIDNWVDLRKRWQVRPAAPKD